jgi:POT family proton-dependent oligopeptide transporter
MLFGMLQFYFAQTIFGKIGLSPNNPESIEAAKQAAVEASKQETVAVDELNANNVTKDRLVVIGILAFFTIFFWWAFEQAGGSMTIFANDYTDRMLTGDGAATFKIFNTLLTVIPMIIITWVLSMLFKQTFSKYSLSNILLGASFVIIWGIVIWMLQREWVSESAEVPASWFGILNSFFIIAFAPIFSKIWASKLNPTGPVKFALGLILLGLGFGVLAYGSLEIPLGAKTASVSMIFLILAYLLHTLGELCISPVGLSYVSKLAPAKLIGLMFGVWFVANFIANTAAGITGSYMDPILEEKGLSYFFMIFTLIPISAGVVMLMLNKMLLRKMHGIR